MTDISFGYHSVGWGEDFLGFLSDIADLGFRGIESGSALARMYDGREDAFRRILKERGLTLLALYCGGELTDSKQREHAIEENKQVIDFLARVAAPMFVFTAGSRHGRPPTKADVGRFIESAHLLGAYCRKRGIKACLHPGMGTTVQTFDEIRQIMNGSDPELLHLCPDTAHLFRGGCDPADVHREFRSRIAYTHWMDLGDEMDGACADVELGRGRVNFKSLLAAMNEGGYRGWVTVEVDTCRKSPRDSAIQCKKFLTTVLEIDI